MPNRFDLGGEGSRSLGGWFLGPKGENEAILQALVSQAVAAHCQFRRDFHPEDPPYLSDSRRDAEYHRTIGVLQSEFGKLLQAMRGSIPISSYRNHSHMYGDITLPSTAGYFAAMLYNQNNVAAEASPVTTELELAVGDDLCRMLGFPVPDTTGGDALRPWGHITCDGSVANAESMWAARNLKCYPVSVARALAEQPQLKAAQGVEVTTSRGARTLLSLTPWELLNLPTDEILALPQRVSQAAQLADGALDGLLMDYLVQTLGLAEFLTSYLPGIAMPVVMAPSTAHYSWRKAGALLGIGRKHVLRIHVDRDCRVQVAHLREALEDCLQHQRPVLQVVAVMGTTEEGAVDPLAEIVDLRHEFAERGLEFALHADGAWGGYFRAMLRRPDETGDVRVLPIGTDPDTLPMSAYVRRHMRAIPHCDTVTIDPHKSGFAPYPAGGLCYRNGKMRSMVSFTAPVVFHGGVDPTVGVYGIEGSKPGAAAAGVYLSHRLLRPDTTGYGEVLGNCMWNSKRFYAGLVTLAQPDDPFVVVPMQRLPAERAIGDVHHPDRPPAAVAEQLEFIRKYIVPKNNSELRDDGPALALLNELGSDLIIVAYALNFRLADGTLNCCAAEANAFNNDLFAALSLHPDGSDSVPTLPMLVTDSAFDVASYGQEFVTAFGERLGLDRQSIEQEVTSLAFLISTTQNPWVTDATINATSPDGNLLHVILDGFRETVLACVARAQARAGACVCRHGATT